MSPVPRSSWPCPSSSARSCAVVVDLAVEDGDDVAVLVRDGLVAGREVDHAEAAVAERAAPERGGRAVIGAAMADRVARGADDRDVVRACRRRVGGVHRCRTPAEPYRRDRPSRRAGRARSRLVVCARAPALARSHRRDRARGRRRNRAPHPLPAWRLRRHRLRRGDLDADEPSRARRRVPRLLLGPGLRRHDRGLSRGAVRVGVRRRGRRRARGRAAAHLRRDCAGLDRRTACARRPPGERRRGPVLGLAGLRGVEVDAGQRLLRLGADPGAARDPAGPAPRREPAEP